MTTITSIDAFEKQTLPEQPPPSRRVVYLEDELDIGDDNIDMGFLSENALEDLPALSCSNACNQGILSNTLSNSENACNQTVNAALRPTETIANLEPCGPKSALSSPESEERREIPLPSSSTPKRKLLTSSSVPSLLSSNIATPSERHRRVPSYSNYHENKTKRTPERKPKATYARFLLESDKELERVAQSIRTDIRAAEMVELALEAERAANAGASSFHGRASTFGDDTDLLDSYKKQRQYHQQEQLFFPLALRRHQTFTEGVVAPPRPLLDTQQRKIRVLALRDISEVIPHFSELHSHLRTHLARENVSKKSLVYEERKAVNGCQWIANSGPETAMQEQLQAVDCGGIAAVAMLKQAGFKEQALTTSLHKWAAKFDCDELRTLDRIADDASQQSSDSTNSGYGVTLSSHLSPRKVRRPRVRTLPGLSIPFESKTVDPLPHFEGYTETSYSRDSHTHSPQRLQPDPELSHIDEINANRSNDAAESPASPSVFREEKKDTASDLDSLISLHASLFPDEMSPSSLALFDTDDSCSSRAPSPTRSSPDPLMMVHEPPPIPPRHEPVPLTPKDGGWSRKGGSDFLTPARLRDIRGHHPRNDAATSIANSSTPPARQAISTPDPMRFTFEPSSIIDSGKKPGPIKPQEDAPLAGDQAMFLALPSIQDVPNEKYNPLVARQQQSGTEADTFERRFRYPRRSQEDHQFQMSNNDEVFNPNHAVHVHDGTQQHAATAAGNSSVAGLARENPADSSSASSARSEDYDVPAADSPHKTVLWTAKEKILPPISPNLRGEEQEFCSASPFEHPKRDELEEQASENSRVPREEPPSSPEGSHADCRRQIDDNLHGFAGDMSTALNSVQECEEAGGSQQLNRRLVYEVGPSNNDEKFHDRSNVRLISLGGARETLMDGHQSTGRDFAAAKGLTFDTDSKSQLALRAVGTWGGRFSEDHMPEFRRSRSCPDIQSLNKISESNDFDCTVRTDIGRPVEESFLNDSALVYNSFSSTERQILHQSLRTPRRESPSTGSFKAAFDTVIAGLSPRREAMKDFYISEADNKEFLNNYFYCSKSEEALVPGNAEEAAVGAASCVEPCNAGEALCQIENVENVCASFNSFFSPYNFGSPSLRPRTMTGSSDRALSLGREGESELEAETWFGMLGMASSRFSLNLKTNVRGGGGDDNSEKQLKQFQPPCLKKTGTHSPAKPSSAHKIVRTPAKNRLPPQVRNSDHSKDFKR